jgi:hypothetical protein
MDMDHDDPEPVNTRHLSTISSSASSQRQHLIRMACILAAVAVVQVMLCLIQEGAFDEEFFDEDEGYQIDDMTITSENLRADSDNDTYDPPTLPASSLKRRFSELESVDPSSQSPIPGSSSTPIGIPPASSSVNPCSSAKRQRTTDAISLSSLQRELSETRDLMCQHLELTKTNLEEWNLKCEEIEHMEQNPALRATHHMQEVDSDLSPDDQAALVDLFAKKRDIATTYLLLKSDPIRKAWIKHKLAQADSG